LKFKAYPVVMATLFATTACNVTVKNDTQEAPSNTSTNMVQAAPQPQPLSPAAEKARAPLQDLQFQVDISDRKVRLVQAGRLVAEHPVAVGTSKWPTPTGTWKLHRVDINPEWNPPKDESWAEDREPKAAGDPKNPMGRARLVYRMPNTIHGTNDLQSLGKASSHGSIRVANDVVLGLAETLLKAGGAWESPEAFKQMTENRTREYQIELPHPVPIEVRD
jgi:lipoprotein-anchoring transpeptidase ErfK/SrfK